MIDVTVGAWTTTWSGESVPLEAANSAVPAYVALTVWLPTARLDVVRMSFTGDECDRGADIEAVDGELDRAGRGPGQVAHRGGERDQLAVPGRVVVAGNGGRGGDLGDREVGAHEGDRVVAGQGEGALGDGVGADGLTGGPGERAREGVAAGRGCRCRW